MLTSSTCPTSRASGRKAYILYSILLIYCYYIIIILIYYCTIITIIIQQGFGKEGGQCHDLEQYPCIPQKRLQTQEEAPRNQGDNTHQRHCVYRPVFSESLLGFGESLLGNYWIAPWPSCTGFTIALATYVSAIHKLVCLKHVVVCLFQVTFWNVGCWNDC